MLVPFQTLFNTTREGIIVPAKLCKYWIFFLRFGSLPLISKTVALSGSFVTSTFPLLWKSGIVPIVKVATSF